MRIKAKDAIPVLIAILALALGSYIARWILALIVAGILFAYSLEGWEPKLPNLNIRRERNDEVRRLSLIIKRTEFSETSRKIVIEHLKEAYRMIGINVNENPPKAIKLLQDDPSNFSRLDEILRMVEEDINERSG
ncbi:hypothetical protein [Pyrococcus abyssi]|uniref:Uncharacterized protein n=1 Tax=Pyrococcus abyssi (strain GE5 / Orsay) TaxID=272844 RepID=Q9UZ68_PYRAB|nr:hypothetical protein [Pyrococcus abyssi]CAB50191.1 Hypothetical protein PAB0847 [Pyrococcus abyssi GE5]CCE70725.1 TPA: hypothetical protein PAB0847 [Pyrococcus abyssi GE5]